MSDFNDVEWRETTGDGEVTKDVAPPAIYDAKIIVAEKYKSAKGNWTVHVVFDLANGTFRNHNEYYSLWSANPDAKQISNEIFTQLCKAAGFTQFPEAVADLQGKAVRLKVGNFEDSFQNDEGEMVTVTKTNIKAYMPVVSAANSAQAPKAATTEASAPKRAPTL